jgi:hypothetical protein
MQYAAWPWMRQATEPVSPAAERTARVPVLASRNAPVPKVHLAVPGSQQPSASRAACWSTISPPTVIGAPNAVVVPTISSQSAIRGSASPSSSNICSSSRSQSIRSISRIRERLAVAGSVTNSPVSLWTSQLSVVVTTPSVVTCRRSQVIFGAEKYGSSTSPVRADSSSRRFSRPAHTSAARRSCHTIAGDNGRPLPRSQASTVSPWLASATVPAGRPACASACCPA